MKRIYSACGWCVCLLSVAATVFYFLPSHRTDVQSFSHSEFSDLGVIPAVLLAAASIALFLTAQRKRVYAALIIALATAAAYVAMDVSRLPHLMDDVATTSVPSLALLSIGVLTAMVGAVVHAIAVRRLPSASAQTAV